MRTAVFLIATVLQGMCRAFVSNPQNVSCIGKLYEKFTSPIVTCMWIHDQHTTDISFTVYLKQEKEHTCVSQERTCTFPDDVTVFFNTKTRIHVTAQDFDGHIADSVEVNYDDVWQIVQMDSPEAFIVEPLPTGLRVTYEVDDTFLIAKEYEVRLREKDLNAKLVIKSVKYDEIRTVEVSEVKPCTNYTASVRSRFSDTVWSTWSHEITALSYINVSSLQFRLWRSRSVSDHQGKRTMHLMWKGIPPSCKAVDKYCIFCESLEHPECYGPYQKHTLITIDEQPNKITVAAFQNDTSLNHASIEVPAMAKEVNLPPIRNISVFLQPEYIDITWHTSRLPVTGYIIVWNSTAKNHMWQQTQKNNVTLKVQPSVIYTISLIPLYEEGPGNEVILHNCSQARHLPAVSAVWVLTGFIATRAEIHWLPLFPSQCCAFVLNYTVYYKTQNESETKNVTVGPSQHQVMLEDLHANTEYCVYVMASTVTASSESVPIIFTTKPSIYFLIVLIFCSVLLIVLSMLVVMIRRKFLSKKIPDPQFSSLSMWPSEKCRNSWNLLSPEPGGKNTETILPCHVNCEVISVFPSTKNIMVAVKNFGELQNITLRTTQTQNASLADTFLNKEVMDVAEMQIVSLVPLLDFQTPQKFQLPQVQSPYSQQTPLGSPVQSPTQPLSSDETSILLTPKLKNTTLFSSYLTLDQFDTGKHQAK